VHADTPTLRHSDTPAAPPPPPRVHAGRGARDHPAAVDHHPGRDAGGQHGDAGRVGGQEPEHGRRAGRVEIGRADRDRRLADRGRVRRVRRRVPRLPVGRPGRQLDRGERHPARRGRVLEDRPPGGRVDRPLHPRLPVERDPGRHRIDRHRRGERHRGNGGLPM
ncbi:MAG: hypothetical protein AVDCRST_MAG64-1829, partial [uncultured Phycisphaerae bacterium]